MPAATIIADQIVRWGEERAGVQVIGLCGAQGSGKSTVARQTADQLSAQGWPSAVLALDDLYLGKLERERLADRVHPLLAVRGPPGTHDTDLGAEIIDAVRTGRPIGVPAFDKVADDRLPEDRWTTLRPPLRVLIFEGWCVGASPQQPEALERPINRLETERDADGAWRHYVNDALAGPYQALFSRLDRLILLKAPSFEVVARWRGQQEDANLKAHTGGGKAMSQEEIADFIQYYERLTRHMLADIPQRADLVLELDAERRVTGVTHNG